MNITISKLKFCVLAFSISFLSCQEDIREVILYTAGQQKHHLQRRILNSRDREFFIVIHKSKKQKMDF
jgi:hypothetical protein